MISVTAIRTHNNFLQDLVDIEALCEVREVLVEEKGKLLESISKELKAVIVGMHFRC